jgi:peptidoglycan/LPS O-acetylase OafA/YrhL
MRPMQADAGAERAPRNAGLDAIRVAACALVVAYHLHVFTGLDLGPVSQGGGPAGVAMFFALSGYLITKSAAGSLPGYTVLRVARLWPAYLLALVGLTLITGSSQVPDHPIEYALVLQNYDPSTFHQFIVPAWTLAIEIVFYLVAPVLVRLPLSATILLGAASLAGWLVLVVVGVSSLFWIASMPFMFWLFVPGIVVGRGVRLPKAPILGVALIVLGLVGGTLPDWDPIGLTLVYGAPALGAGMLIAADLTVPMPSVWAAGAAISYAVYLWHGDLIAYGRSAWMLVPALVIASASYVLVERPILRLARSVSRRLGSRLPEPRAGLVPVSIESQTS